MEKCKKCNEILEYLPCKKCKEIKELFIPNNTDLPFFSYGIFRPGEIAYEIIEDLVDESLIEEKNILGSLMLRDGLIIYDINGKDLINGYLIYFKKDNAKEAYKRISDLEPKNYFIWNSNDKKKYSKEFNVLCGKQLTKGVDETRQYNEEKLFKILFSSIWQDPFFIKGFQILADFKSEKLFDKTNKQITKYNKEWDEESKFTDCIKYQMLYTYIWSMFERFNFLYYGFGKGTMTGIRLLSEDPDFKKVFSQLYNNNDFKYLEKREKVVVYSTKDLEKKATWLYNFDSEPDSKILCNTLNFYYQMRSNIIHRGKNSINKYELLKQCFDEVFFLLKNLWDLKEKNADKTKTRIDNLIKSRNEQA